jgi:hypothetical protein
MDEQEHPAGAEGPGPSALGATPPVTEPAIPRPELRRGEGARKALTSRGAGWVVAAILAGAVVAFSVVLATASSTTVLRSAGAIRSFRLAPAGSGPQIVALPPNVPPGSVRVQIPANAPPASVRVALPAVVLPAGGQVHAGRWVQVPARMWIQVPAGVVAPAPKASLTKTAN